MQQRHTSRPATAQSPRRSVTVPSLNLTGRWLEWCGLTPGAVAYIEVNPSSLVITPVPPADATASHAEEPAASYRAQYDANGNDISPASEFVPLLLLPDGSKSDILPTDSVSFHLEQLYAALDCRTVEVVYLGDTDKILIIDEEGSFPADRQRNRNAEQMWWSTTPAAYGLPLLGRAIYCHTSQFR